MMIMNKIRLIAIVDFFRHLSGWLN